MRREISEITKWVTQATLFDFGRAAYAQLELELAEPPTRADLIELVVSECARDGMPAYDGGFRTFKVDTFQLIPGECRYRFHIPKHCASYGTDMPHLEAPAACGGEIAVFRYALVNHYYGKVTLRRIEFYDDAPGDASHFESSCANLDAVWELCKHTMMATSIFPCYIDGERERMPYEGDAYITQLSHFCCTGNYSTARRTIDHFMVNGDKTWPTEWLLCTPMIVRDYLLYSGDRSQLPKWLPCLPEKLLPQFRREDGLLAPTGFVKDIVDWPQGERDNYDFGSANFVPNAYLVGALEAMEELTGDGAYGEDAGRLRNILCAKMLHNGCLVDSPGSHHTSEHTAFFALRFGIAEGAAVAAMKAILRERGMACSVYGAQFLLEAAFLNGLDDLGMKLLTGEGLRSWMNMLRKGATITMEAWDNSLKENQDWSHPWGAAPGNIIPRFVAGVRPLSPGFATFEAKPSPAAPEEFLLRHPTPFGAIEVRKSGGEVEVSLRDADARLVQTSPGEYRVES